MISMNYFEVAYLDVKFVFSHLFYGKFFLGRQSVLFVKRGHNILALQHTNIEMDSWMLLPAVFVDVILIFSLLLGKIFDQLIQSLIFWDLLCQIPQFWP